MLNKLIYKENKLQKKQRFIVNKLVKQNMKKLKRKAKKWKVITERKRKMWNKEIRKRILWLIMFGSQIKESACEKKYTK